MLFDLNKSEHSRERRYDVCVVGAGVAGITLARKLAEAGKRVALCEAGLLGFTNESQDVYRGQVFGDAYFNLDACRLRYFGGSSNHWGGMCRTLDSIDFERGYLGPEFEWPIRKTRLIDPYLREACRVLEIDDQFHDNKVNGSRSVNQIEFKFSPPVVFSTKYLQEISQSAAIDLYVAANFQDVQGSGAQVNSATFRNYTGKDFIVPASTFILAMGGIENSRILLWLNERHGGRFFDKALPIGRYWMEHPRFLVGEAIVDASIENAEYFSLASDLQRERGIMNCRLELDRQGRDTTRRLVNEVLCIAPRLGRRLVSLADRGLVCGVRMRTASEQAPQIDNRIALSPRKDKFGIPFAELHWRKSDFDRETIVSSSALFNQWLMDEDLGRVRLDNWLLNGEPLPEQHDFGGNHHIGGTRMGRREMSVVDENCRVHGSVNIYVAGSSVFATGGHANPTLPLLQFTLRLAHHLSV